MSSQVIIFEIDREAYAVSVLDSREVIKIPKITPVPGSHDFVVGVINLRGKVVPVIDMLKWFSIDRTFDDSSKYIIILEDKNGSDYGVLIDNLKEVLKVDESEIKPTPKMIEEKISPEFLKGVIVIPGQSAQSEKIILVLDLVAAMSKLSLESLGQIGNNENVINNSVEKI